MNKKTFPYTLSVLSLSGCFLLGGCNSDSPQPLSTPQPIAMSSPAVTATEAPASQTALPSEEANVPSTGAEAPTAETKPITITISNMCGADFGMFSMIDPATGEQINLGSLAHEETLSIEASWPVDVPELQWAVYNTAGELCLEGKTDITDATTDAVLRFSGNGTVESTETLFH